MHGLADGRALGAMRAAVDRAVPAGLLTRPDAVLHLRQNRAADRTMGTDVLPYLGRRARGRPRNGLGLAHGAEPQRCDRGQATPGADRKSVVEGKRVSVRVDLGGRRKFKKKK